MSAMVLVSKPCYLPFNTNSIANLILFPQGGNPIGILSNVKIIFDVF